MAQLIIGPKTFAAVMRSIYGYKNLKIQRVIEQTLARKSNLVINLNAASRDEISDTVAEAVVSNYMESPFNDDYAYAHDPQRKDLAHLQVGAKSTFAIQYSVREWKDAVIKHSLHKSSELDERKLYGVYSINLSLVKYRQDLDNFLYELLSRGSNARTSN